MNQDDLKNKIIKTYGMDGCNPKKNPTTVESSLGKYANGKPMQYQDWWKHASVIVMLMYVTSNPHTKIDFSVHQCARFTHNPKK